MIRPICGMWRSVQDGSKRIARSFYTTVIEGENLFVPFRRAENFATGRRFGTYFAPFKRNGGSPGNLTEEQERLSVGDVVCSKGWSIGQEPDDPATIKGMFNIIF